MRIEPNDEISLKNKQGAMTPYNAMGFTKSVGGAFVNSLDVMSQCLPGNFGVRVAEAMPTNLSLVWRERQNTQLGFTCSPATGYFE